MNRSAKTSPLLVLVVAGIILGGGGAAYYFTRTDAEKKSIDDAAENAKLLAEVQIVKRKIQVYKAFVKACADAKAGLNAEPPKYEGYDAFSYKDESKYRTELGAQEARMSDLKSRLGGAFNE